jgi:Spy/CpxP family protein refolding chaperone
MKLQFTVLAAAATIAMIVSPVAAFPGPTKDAASYYERVGIQLSAAQKSKITAIETDAIAKIDKVYNAEQRSIVTEARSTMESINLSDAQKKQLVSYTSDPSKDFRNILTADQQKQLRQNHQNKKVGLLLKQPGSPVEMLKAQGIQLTPTQETQLAELHKQRRAAVDAIYSPDQLKKLQAARTKLESIQLTSRQSEEIAAIRKAAWQAKEDVLTPDQKQKLPRS